MADRYNGVAIKVTEKNLGLMHRRIKNFATSNHARYTKNHNFDVNFKDKGTFGEIKQYNRPANEVELHIPGCEKHRSEAQFVRVVCSYEAALMVYVGDEIFFTKDSIVVKSDWQKNWGANPKDGPKYLFSRFIKQPKVA